MRAISAVRGAPVPVRLLVGVLIAIAVGVSLHALRAVPGPRVDAIDAVLHLLSYVGEAAAPYVLVPFAVGLLARTRRGAAVGGVVSCWFLVAAYYSWWLPGTQSFVRGGVAEQMVWMVAAVLAGACGGLLGFLSTRRRWVSFVMPAFLILEPVAWLLLLHIGVAPVLAQPKNVVGATVEAALGLLWCALLVRQLVTGRVKEPVGGAVQAGTDQVV